MKVGREEDFGAYLIWHREVDAALDFFRYLIREGFDPVLVSPQDIEFTSDEEVVVLEPEREEKAIFTDSLLKLRKILVNHLREGDRRAVVIYDVYALKNKNDFRDLTDFIGRLYEEACVNRGLVLLFADREEFAHQELAFLEREAAVLECPEDLFSSSSETVK